MRIIYGIQLQESNDQHYQMIERAIKAGEALTIPGRFPVEAIPALRYLPSWFPGGTFKRWAAETKREIQEGIDSLFYSAKNAMVSALHVGSFSRSKLYP